MNQSLPKALVLDWGGVLCEDPTQGFVAFAARHFQKPAESVLAAIRKHLDAYTRGLEEAPFWQRVSSELDAAPPSHSLWGEALRAVYKVNHDIVQLSLELKAKGVRIGFLSNTEKPARDFHLQQGYDFIEARVFSCDEGLAKPEKAIYDLICERLQLPMGECLMVDDRIENIHGALAAGMRAHHFTHAQQLRSELGLQ